MLNPKSLRENKAAIEAGLKKRGHDTAGLDHYVAIDEQWRNALQEIDALKHDRNANTPKGKPSPEQLASLKSLSEQIKNRQDDLNNLEAAVKTAALELPNVPDESVPDGNSEADNVEVRQVGSPNAFDFSPKSHDVLGSDLGILDFEAGSHITGSRFTVYKGMGARLERALINFMLDVHRESGYTEVMPPVIVNSQSLQGTGQLPKFKDDLFKIDDTDYWLSPTAEVQVTNLMGQKIIDQADLPVKMTAYTPCFRKEAGSHGKDVKGIIRQHQFNKVELLQFTHPDQSFEQLEVLLSNAEEILKRLELPYRVVTLCGGDLGFSSAKTYDIEVWLPSQEKFREISSCSNFLDFQARRAMIRYREAETGAVNYLHTLNGSGVAVGRAFAAILENNQCADGSIIIPKALIPYLGEDKIQ